jgi:hypothetical protein
VTAWRRLREWQRAGVWERLHRELLRRLNAAGRINWSRGVVDSSHIRALQGGLTGPSPVDRARTGSKHHLLVGAAGVPLVVTLTGGNRNDITQLLPLVDGIMPVAGKVGRRVSGLTGSSPGGATTTTLTGASYGAAASNRASLGAEPSTAQDSGDGVGWSSVPSRGCTTTAACASAGNATQPYIWPS